jgi:hypothetical protein
MLLSFAFLFHNLFPYIKHGSINPFLFGEMTLETCVIKMYVIKMYVQRDCNIPQINQNLLGEV